MLHNLDERTKTEGGGGSGREEEGDAVVPGSEAGGELGGRKDVAGVGEGENDDLAVGHPCSSDLLVREKGERFI